MRAADGTPCGDGKVFIILYQKRKYSGNNLIVFIISRNCSDQHMFIDHKFESILFVEITRLRLFQQFFSIIVKDTHLNSLFVFLVFW